MWHVMRHRGNEFRFKALSRQFAIAPIAAALAFDGGGFAGLQFENQRIDFGTIQCALVMRSTVDNAITTSP